MTDEEVIAQFKSYLVGGDMWPFVYLMLFFLFADDASFLEIDE